MREFKGIEDVDLNERAKQYTLTEALWSELRNQGLIEGTPGQIECIFFAENAESRDALLPAFAGWKYDVAEPNTPDEDYLIRVISPPVHLSKDAFLELVDVSLIAANQSACTFDGFQVDTTGLRKRPWWRFW